MLTAGQLAHALAFARHGHAVLPLTWPIRGSTVAWSVAAGKRPTAFRLQNILTHGWRRTGCYQRRPIRP